MQIECFDSETRGKILQFFRLLISYNDFKHAGDIASYILQKNLHNRKKGEFRMLLEALNCAMIVAYCRPFSGNDRKTKLKIPDLPGRFLRTLDQDERELHRAVMDDRNAVLAHSDSTGWNLRPIVLELNGKKNIYPLSNDTRAPLTREATERLGHLSYKLMEAVFADRMTLQPQLVSYLESIEFADVDLEEIKREFLKGVEAAKRAIAP